MLAVEMEAGTNPDLALVDVNNKVRAKVSDLPKDANEPVSMKFDINAQPFLIASFTSELPEKEAKKFIDDRIKPLVARVEVISTAGNAQYRKTFRRLLRLAKCRLGYLPR